MYFGDVFPHPFRPFPVSFFLSSFPFPLSFPHREAAPQILQVRDLGECCYVVSLPQQGRTTFAATRVLHGDGNAKIPRGYRGKTAETVIRTQPTSGNGNGNGVYTVSQKKLGHFYFYCNFVKCWPILIIFFAL